MQKIMRYARHLVWLLPIIVLIVFAIIIAASSFGASDKHFNRMVGWAAILAAIISLATLAGQVISWVRPGRLTPGILDDHTRVIAKEVLIAEDRALRHLVGGDEIAEVRFQAEHRESPSDERVLSRLRELVRFTDESGRHIGDISTVAQYFRDLALPRMIVLGPPGAGKTIMLISLTIQLLRNSRDQLIAPVRVDLAGFDPFVNDFANWLAGRISLQYRIAEPVALKLIETGRILPILDGLDEMDASDGTPERGNAALRKIDAYIAGAELGVVLASREAGWQRVSPALGRQIGGAVIRIQPLNLRQIQRYVSTRLSDETTISTAWSALLRQLEHKSNSYIGEVLSRPLWLYLAVLEFKDKPADLLLAADAQRLRTQLLAGFVSAATREPPSQKKSAKTSYHEDSVMRWLRELASFINKSPGGDIDRINIVPDRLWLIAGTLRVRLLHTLLASVMAAVTFLLVWPNLKAVISGLDSSLGGYDQGAIISLVIAGAWLIYNILRDSIDVSAPPLFIGLRFQRIRAMPSTKTVLAWLRKTLRQAFIDGYLGRLAISFFIALPAAVSDLAVIPVPDVVATLFFAVILLYVSLGCLKLIIMVIFAPIQAFIKLTSPEPLRPYDTLRRDRYYWLAFVLILPILASATPPFSWSAVFHITFLALFLSVLISRASIRYAIAVTLEATSGRLPLRLQSFLIWAVHTGLLREAGPAYQFRHVELQRWLTLSATAQGSEGDVTKI